LHHKALMKMTDEEKLLRRAERFWTARYAVVEWPVPSIEKKSSTSRSRRRVWLPAVRSAARRKL